LDKSLKLESNLFIELSLLLFVFELSLLLFVIELSLLLLVIELSLLLLVIELSLLRFTDSDYPFGIFKLLLYLYYVFTFMIYIRKGRRHRDHMIVGFTTTCAISTLVSSTNKTDRHDITELLLKVAFCMLMFSASSLACIRENTFKKISDKQTYIIMHPIFNNVLHIDPYVYPL
jgi:hypothetical protein